MHRPVSVLTLATIGAASLVKNPPSIPDIPGEQLQGPTNPADPASVEEWRQALVTWRTRMRKKIAYNGSIYDVPELKWTQTSYIQPQMLVAVVITVAVVDQNV